MLQVILVSIVLVVVGVVAIRRPELIARFMASSTRVSQGNKKLTETEEIARTIREDGLEWRIKYPELYRFIVGIGYVALGFCVVIWLGFIISVLFQ